MQQTKARAASDPGGPEVERLLRVMLAGGMAITPSLSVSREWLCGPSEVPPAQDAPLLAPRSEVRGPAPCFPGLTRSIEETSLQTLGRTAKRYHDMGGTILVGTDQGLVPGAGAPIELETMVEFGFTHADALIAATRNGARALGRADIGTIEVGKRADLLLVEGRPDQNIGDIRRLRIVFKNGIGYDPASFGATLAV